MEFGLLGRPSACSRPHETMPATASMRDYSRRGGPAPIAPESLYPLAEFYAAARIGRSTVNRGRELGVELKTFRVGRVKYVNGVDGIAYLKALAEAQAAA